MEFYGSVRNPHIHTLLSLTDSELLFFGAFQIADAVVSEATPLLRIFQWEGIWNVIQIVAKESFPVEGERWMFPLHQIRLQFSVLSRNPDSETLANLQTQMEDAEADLCTQSDRWEYALYLQKRQQDPIARWIDQIREMVSFKESFPQNV